MKDRTEFTKEINHEDISSFVKITGDDNPIHTNSDDLKTSKVREKLGIQRACAHGPLITALICKPIMELGGPGTVLLETGPFHYLRPVQVGDSVSIECIYTMDMGRDRHRIKVTIQNKEGEDIIRPTYAVVLRLD